MQRGSPLSIPPANEQRRCAEKTSRIFKAQVCLHHAEAAEGFSHSACGGCKGGNSPFNPARKRAAEVRREDQSHLQAQVCLYHGEAAQGFSRSPCGGCKGVYSPLNSARKRAAEVRRATSGFAEGDS